VRLAAVAVLLLALAGGLLLFLLRDPRRPEGAAASGLERASLPETKEELAPESLGEVETARPDEFRQEVESSAAVAGEGDWTVRVLRDGKPAAGVEVVWATPEMHRAIVAAPDPAVPDWMDRLWNAGRRTRADAGGEASIPALEPESYVFARDGGATAYHRVLATDVPPILLALERDFTLRARVVDASGAPQAGCLVTAGIRAGAEMRRTMATTRQDGVATCFHFGVGWGIDPAHDRGHVRVDGLFEPPVEVEFDLEPFPETPLELVLPPHGSVAIEVVDDAGEPVQVTHHVRLSVEHPQHPGARTNARRTDPTAEVVAGKATFPHVGLGLALQAELDDRPAHESARLSFDGPAEAGEVRTVQLVLMPGALVRFRVLQPSGAPVAEGEVQVSLLREVGGSSVGTGNSANTDAGGFVSLPLTGAWIEGARMRVKVQHRSPDGEDLEGSLEIVRPLTHGVNELGDVRLHETPVLLAGRVVDGDGDPVSGAGVSIKHVEMSRTGHAIQLGDYFARADENGRFVRRGEPSGQSLEVWADAPENRPSENAPSAPVRVVAGTRGLEIVLRRGGGLRGSLRIPAGVPPRAILVEIPAPGGLRPRQAQPDASGRFELLGLTPGLVDVAVLLRAGGKRLASIGSVDVVGGEIRRDARLQDIELEGLLRRLTIGVRAADGTPASGGWVRVLGPTEKTGAAVAFVIENGQAKVIGEAAPLDLEVNVPGHRIARLLDVESDREVQLEPAFMVTLALKDGVDLPPAGGRLQVNLVPVGDDAAPARLDLLKDGENAGAWHSAFGDESNAFGPSREIAFAVQQSGPHEVRFAVVYGDQFTSSVSFPVRASAESRRLDLQPSDAGRTFRVAPDRDDYAKRLASGH
jgi:hypothetical protein